MNTFKPYRAIILIAFLLTACFEDTKIVFEDTQLEFESAVLLAKATGEVFPIINLNRASGTLSYQINLAGKQLPEAESISFSVEDVPDRLLNSNTVRAVEGVHFTLNGNSISFPELTNKTTFPAFSVDTDFPAEPGKSALFIIRLDGNDKLKPAENFRRLGFRISLDADNPTMTFRLRGQWGQVVNSVRQRPVIPLKNGARDTTEIIFNREISVASPPTVTASTATAAWANIGTPVAYENNDGIANNSFYVPVEATSIGTGNLSLIVAGAVSSIGVPIIEDNVANTTTVAIDNAPPQAVSRAWSATRIGRSQSSTVTVTFNEPVSASLADSIYINISGQSIDPVVNRRMTLSTTRLTATYIYTYKDSSIPTDVTSGALTITYGGGKDVAGNDLNLATIAIGGVSTDVSALNATDNAVITAAPGVPVITLAPVYDLGTQIKWRFTVSGPGATTGTLFFLILKDGTTPPTNFQRFADVQGVKVYNGFDVTDVVPADNIVAQGSTSTFGSDIFTPFTPNGDFDVYAYWVTTTGNASPVSGILANITMQ